MPQGTVGVVGIIKMARRTSNTASKRRTKRERDDAGLAAIPFKFATEIDDGVEALRTLRDADATRDAVLEQWNLLLIWQVKYHSLRLLQR